MADKQRIYFLDYIRGFLILMVIIQHTLYDLDAIFGVSIPLLWSPLGWFLRDFGVTFFVGISGFCANLSRSNLRRGWIALGVAMGITLITYTFMYSQRISFGIIHLMAVCMILYGCTERWIKKIPPMILVILGSALFLFFFGLPDGYVGVGSILKVNVPGELYSVDWLFPLGLPTATYTSADYYPIIPWIFLFFAGSGLGRILLSKGHPKWWYKNPFPALGWVGRNTMIIYIVHQPVVYAILYLIFDNHR